jgi:hypothetical protein
MGFPSVSTINTGLDTHSTQTRIPLRHTDLHEGLLTEMHQAAVDNVTLARRLMDTPLHMFLASQPFRPQRYRCRADRPAEARAGDDAHADSGSHAARDEYAEEERGNDGKGVLPWLPAGIAFGDMVRRHPLRR